jgi:capsular exopolysaccharide synthesis family protein
VSIANSGKRCLLIDADFRRPLIHTLFHVEREVGVSSVIAGEIEPDAAVQPGPVPGLDLMTAGPRTHNPSELLLSLRFADMLTRLRDRYDLILLDSPPLLAVSDPSTVAALADGVLLVLRITKRIRPHAVRAREMLDLVGARLMGVVVNAIGESTGYEFGTGSRGSCGAAYRVYDARHGNGYKYGAGDGYGYHDYYQEGADAAPGGDQERAGRRHAEAT